jgi:hypothetical protein
VGRETPSLAAIKGGGNGQLRLIVERFSRYSRVILGRSSRGFAGTNAPQARGFDCSESDLILVSENNPYETFNVSVAVPRPD